MNQEERDAGRRDDDAAITTTYGDTGRADDAVKQEEDNT